jgi:DNA replication protein DnaC
MNTDLDTAILKMREMKMSSLASRLTEMAAEPNFGMRSAEDVITDLIDGEYAKRKSRRLRKYLKEAHLKFPAAGFDNSIQDPDRKIDTELIHKLAECQWINDKKNLIVTGKSGTGKTYLMNALAVCAMERGKHVRYSKASLMINELNDAQFAGGYDEVLKQYTKPDLLIIDDFGLMSLDVQKCQQMFEVLDAREDEKSIIVISQIPVSSWYDIFQNSVYADACLSRLTGSSYRLVLDGRDMRRNTSSTL